MISKRISLAACLLSLLCGCEQESEPAPEPTAYEDMTFAQRHELMNDVVLPEMKRVFVAFDAKFEGMTCATCHGKGAEDGSYAMPTPDLPVLPATEEAFYEYIKDPEHARWSQFMLDKVFPGMAELLEIAPFDPKTNPDGFSCHNCHMVEGEL
jgi:hypothetical protein